MVLQADPSGPSGGLLGVLVDGVYYGGVGGTKVQVPDGGTWDGNNKTYFTPAGILIQQGAAHGHDFTVQNATFTNPYNTTQFPTSVTNSATTFTMNFPTALFSPVNPDGGFGVFQLLQEINGPGISKPATGTVYVTAINPTFSATHGQITATLTGGATATVITGDGYDFIWVARHGSQEYQPQPIVYTLPVSVAEPLSGISLINITALGTGNGTYQARLVGCAGFDIKSTDSCTLINCTAKNCTGDSLTTFMKNPGGYPPNTNFVIDFTEGMNNNNGFNSVNPGREGWTCSTINGGTITNFTSVSGGEHDLDFESDLGFTGSGNLTINNFTGDAGVQFNEQNYGTITFNNLNLTPAAGGIGCYFTIQFESAGRGPSTVGNIVVNDSTIVERVTSSGSPPASIYASPVGFSYNIPESFAYSNTPVNAISLRLPQPGTPFTFDYTGTLPNFYSPSGGSFIIPVTQVAPVGSPPGPNWARVDYTAISGGLFTGCNNREAWAFPLNVIINSAAYTITAPTVTLTPTSNVTLTVTQAVDLTIRGGTLILTHGGTNHLVNYQAIVGKTFTGCSLNSGSVTVSSGDVLTLTEELGGWPNSYPNGQLQINNSTLTRHRPAGLTTAQWNAQLASSTEAWLAEDYSSIQLCNTTYQGTIGEADVTSFSATGGPGCAPPLTVPVFTNSATKTFIDDLAKTVAITATGNPTPTITLTNPGALPDGVTFASGLLGGTPNDVPGNYNLVFHAHNSQGTTIQNFTLVLTPSSNAPNISSAPQATFEEDQFGTFTIHTQGTPTCSIAVAGTLPTGVTFHDNGNGTGTISGFASQSGDFPLTITAHNGVVPDDVDPFDLSVVYQPPPEFTSANNVTFTQLIQGFFAVTSDSTPAPTITLTDPADLPAGITFVGGVLGGQAQTFGVFDLVFQAQNIGGTVNQPFTFTVAENPGDPIFTTVAQTSFNQDQFSIFTVQTQADPVASLSQLGALPEGLSFVDNGDGTGTLSGTPVTSGTFGFFFSATNVLETVNQLFGLTIVGEAFNMQLTKQGFFGWAGGGKNGAIVDLWAADRFATAPQQDSAPPDSTPPDAGPVTTGIDFGGPGAYDLNPAAVQDYYQRVQYGGHSYWGLVPAGTLGGQPTFAGSPGIISSLSYDAASPYTVSSSTLTAIDSVNLALPPFVAPISGNVQIQWSALLDDLTPNGTHFGVLFTDTGSCPTEAMTVQGQSPFWGRATYTAIATGLTVGDAYQFQLGAAVDTGTSAISGIFTATVTAL